MAGERDGYNVNFDPFYQYQDPEGRLAVRPFNSPNERVAYVGKGPLFATVAPVAAAPAASSALQLALAAIAVVILGIVIGIPLAVIFGIIIPNASTDVSPGTTVMTTIVPRTVTPVVNPETVAPPRKTLLVDCPNNIYRNTDQGKAYAVVTWNPPTVLSQTEGQVQLTPTIDPNTEFQIGSRLVHYMVTDGAGNRGACSFRVNVTDNEPPSVKCPNNITRSTDPLSSSARVYWPEPNVTDNSGYAVAVRQVTDEPGSHFHVGPHIVTLIYHDRAKNEGRCSFFILVEDREAPRVMCPRGVIGYTNTPLTGTAPATWTDPKVDDNTSKMLRATCTPASGSAFVFGSTPVTCTATDAAGNTGNCTFDVDVRYNDTEKPEFDTCPSNIVENVTTDSDRKFVTWSAPTATDNSMEPPDITVNTNPDQEYEIGMYEVVYTATDAAENFAECRFTVRVVDRFKPAITCPDDFSFETDAGSAESSVASIRDATASDNSMKMVTITTDPLNLRGLRIGNHTVTYTATDQSGNSASCNATVMIIDTHPPTFTPPDSFIVPTEPGEDFAIVHFPLPTNVMDNSGGDVTITTMPVNNSEINIGNHSVKYTLSDPFGISDSFTVNFWVIDQEKPALTCPENITKYTDVDKSFVSVNYTPPVLEDNDGKDPSLSANYPSGHNFIIGETEVILTARDGSGNEMMCSFNVTVIDDDPPNLQCPNEVIVYSDELSIPLAFSSVVATWTITVEDNSGLPLTTNESTHVSGSAFSGPCTNVTHTAVDAYNNRKECSFCVKVIGFVNTMCTVAGSNLNLSELTGTEVRYHLLSPNYDVGDPYPSSIECVWYVTAPSGNYIRINFGSFATQTGKDILYIGNGLNYTLENTSVASYGGRFAELNNGTQHTKDQIFKDTIWLHFKSDSTFTQNEPGFWLRFDFIPDPRALYPASYSFCAEFDGFPCLDGSCIDISKRCDGTNNDCPNNEDEMNCTQASVCPTLVPTKNADFTSTDGVYHVDIISDNYPGDYPPCDARWNVSSDHVRSVRLVVMDLQIASGDRLYVIDQNTMNAVTPDIVSPISMHIMGSTSIAVIFESGGGVGRGFWIRLWRYISVTTDFVDFPAYCEIARHGLHCGTGECTAGVEKCDGNTDCSTFENDIMDCVSSTADDCGTTSISLGNEGSMYHLTSVNYPADFVFGTSCEYFVTTTAATILVSFRDVEFLSEDGSDFLRIGNGPTISEATEIIRVKGVFLPQDVKSTGNQLWIRFVTNRNINSRGFWIVLVAQGV